MITVLERTPPLSKYTASNPLRGILRSHVNVPSPDTSTVILPCSNAPEGVKRIHGVSNAPIPKPVVVPDTIATRFIRLPEIVIVAPVDGVTALDAAEAADQPAPVNAFTVKVYVVPFVSPTTSHDSAGAATRHIRPPGEATAWYVDTA